VLAHIDYWAGLAAAGSTIAYGPVNDPAGSYGIAIILADNQMAAHAVRDADPAMLSAHGFRTEIVPMPRLVTRTAVYNGVW